MIQHAAPVDTLRSTELLQRPPPVDALPASRPGRWITGGLAFAVASYLAFSFATSPNIQWAEVWNYIGDGQILTGLWLTLVLTFLCMALGIIGGILLAVMNLSANPALRSISWCYVLFFRGTPLLVQIIFWFNLSIVFPHIGGIPTNQLITAFVAALLGLGLNEAAYMAEIVRGGVKSVDGGQSEAATASGLTQVKAMRYVVLPQALRAIIPPTGNQFVSMLKTTSLVSVIGTQELLTKAQHIYSQNFLTIELLIVTCFWYLLVTTVATAIQSMMENRLSAGDRTQRMSGTERWEFLKKSLRIDRKTDSIDWTLAK